MGFAGDIIALAGLKDTTTGDTLCAVKEPVVLETMTFPDPVIEIAVEPKTKNDQEKNVSGPSAPCGRRPVLPCGNRPRKRSDHHEGYGRTSPGHSGGSGQFAEVKMIISPTAPGEGDSFESRIVGGAVPKEYIPGVEKGIQSVMDSGPLAGFPVIDFKVALIDGKFHDVDSSVLAFEIAARMGMREGMKLAGAKLLEPVMKVEVITPEEYTGNIIGDLTSRRGRVSGQEPRGNAVAINAFVPLANMFGYINNLRSMSSGRAQFTMQFDHYDPVPSNISEEIQAKYA